MHCLGMWPLHKVLLYWVTVYQGKLLEKRLTTLRFFNEEVKSGLDDIWNCRKNHACPGLCPIMKNVECMVRVLSKLCIRTKKFVITWRYDKDSNTSARCGMNQFQDESEEPVGYNCPFLMYHSCHNAESKRNLLFETPYSCRMALQKILRTTRDIQNLLGRKCPKIWEREESWSNMSSQLGREIVMSRKQKV